MQNLWPHVDKAFCMMTTIDLVQLASENGITVEYFPMHGNAVALNFDGKYFIALNPKLKEPYLKEALAHELGHCFTRGFYSIYTPYETLERIEASADHWAYKKLLPPEFVQELARKEIVCYWEIADEMCLSESFVKNAIEYYSMLGII